MLGLSIALSVVISGPPAECIQAECTPTEPEERYYLVVYGAQSVPYRIRHTHNWATFLKTIRADDGSVAVHADTISWMPATLRIRPFAPLPEPSVNLTLEETLAWSCSVRARVYVLGPYEIDCEHYERLLARKADLESGGMTYRAIGGFTFNSRVSNCGQSFTRAAPIVGSRYWQPTPEPGKRGTIRLTHRYIRAGEFIEPHLTHDWLLPVLGGTLHDEQD